MSCVELIFERVSDGWRWMAMDGDGPMHNTPDYPTARELAATGTTPWQRVPNNVHIPPDIYEKYNHIPGGLTDRPGGG